MREECVTSWLQKLFFFLRFETLWQIILFQNFSILQHHVFFQPGSNCRLNFLRLLCHGTAVNKFLMSSVARWSADSKKQKVISGMIHINLLQFLPFPVY